MLIGANCMKVLELLDIVSSRNGGPYSYILGWCIIRSIINMRSNKSMKCNCIAGKDVISGKVLSYYFKIDDRLKRSKTGVKKTFERMVHNDFSEVKELEPKIVDNTEEISGEDQKFLRILEIVTKKNGNHYHSEILMSIYPIIEIKLLKEKTSRNKGSRRTQNSLKTTRGT